VVKWSEAFFERAERDRAIDVFDFGEIFVAGPGPPIWMSASGRRLVGVAGSATRLACSAVVLVKCRGASSRIFISRSRQGIGVSQGIHRAASFIFHHCSCYANKWGRMNVACP
jgi:hypothetical protein